MNKLDWNSINEIWNIQIGENEEVAQDFSGRWINKNKYQDYDSEFGWTLIDFGDDEYLVAHIETEKEFPKYATFHPEEEFVINGKIFSINKNSSGEWDINLIEYKKVDDNNETKETSIEDKLIDDEDLDETEDLNEERDELIEDELNDLGEYNDTNNLDTSFSFKNEKNDDEESDIIQKQKREIEFLEKKLEQERDKTQQLRIKNNRKRFSDLNLDSTTMFDNLSSSSSDIESYDDSNLIENLTKKLNEQTIQLQSLKMNEKLNRRKINEMEDSNNISIYDNQFIMNQWRKQFGHSNFATDFAGRIIAKDKFNVDTEGGWNIDYYDENGSNIYIASIESIEKRNGKNKFIIDGIDYVVVNDEGKWKIEKETKYTSDSMSNIASHITPDEDKSFSGHYEMYSSLLINLEHFSVVYLSKFEQFLKETLDKLSLFKEFFVYSNEISYRNKRSNISVYARVFFRSSSTEDEIETLMIALSLKKGMIKFIGNFWNTNEKSHNDKISFSMFLYHHQKHLKFINAQTNSKLLKLYPVPDRIPSNKLIIDAEYNSILKFHENNIWRKLKPYSIDHNDNAYYICDIDIKDFDTSFHKKNNF